MRADTPYDLGAEAVTVEANPRPTDHDPEATLPPPDEVAIRRPAADAAVPGYEIIDELGRGGMGVVYKARQKTLNRLVALKLLAPERVNDTKFAERFTREAQALAALNHPNIVTIYEFGVVAGIQPGGKGDGSKVGAEKSGVTAGFGANPVGKMPPSTAGGTPASTAPKKRCAQPRGRVHLSFVIEALKHSFVIIDFRINK